MNDKKSLLGILIAVIKLIWVIPVFLFTVIAYSKSKLIGVISLVMLIVYSIKTKLQITKKDPFSYMI